MKDSTVIIAVLLVIGAMWYGSQNGWFASNGAGSGGFNIAQYISGWSAANATATPAPTAAPSATPATVDLCATFTPYLGALSHCDGIITCTATNIGCEHNAVAINCVQPEALAAQVQCSAVHANWHCDAANVWCKY